MIFLQQDYIGGEEDEGGHPVVTSPKRKRKGAFISGTVDIDVLLGKVSISFLTFLNSLTYLSLIWSLFLYIISKCQYHQHFMCTFFAQNCFMKLFSSYILVLEFLAPKFCMKNKLVICWWYYLQDTAPTNLVTFGASPPPNGFASDVKPFFEFALPKTSDEVLADLPW